MKKTKYLAALICLYFVLAQVNIYASDIDASADAAAEEENVYRGGQLI